MVPFTDFEKPAGHVMTKNVVVKQQSVTAKNPGRTGQVSMDRLFFLSVMAKNVACKETRPALVLDCLRLLLILQQLLVLLLLLPEISH